MPGTTPKGIVYPVATDSFTPHLDLQAGVTDVDERMPQVLSQDTGFPVAVANVTAEAVLSRITIGAVGWARRGHAVGAAWLLHSQTADCDLLIYAGSSVVARFRANMVADVGRSLTATSVAFAVPANAALVVELRAVRVSPSVGTVSSSVSGSLTTFAATVVAA